MRVLFRYVTLLLTAGLLACSQDAPPPVASSQEITPAPVQLGADRVFTNGKIYTVDESQIWAEAVAVSGDEIVYVGSSDGASQWIGDNTQVEDLAGKLMLPGFIDSHAHPLHGGAYIRSLSLDTFAGPDEWVQQVAEYAEAHPEMPIIFGYGFLASAFGPEGPLASQLDAIVADRPVLIMDEGFHGAWANSLALAQIGVTKDTPDPLPGFSYYKRDAEGNPTGYLLEGTAGSATDALGVISPESVSLGLGDVVDILNSYGVTSVFDAGAMGMESMQLPAIERLVEEGEMTVRMVAAHYINSPDDMEGVVELVANRKATTKSELFHLNTLKISQDGTVEGRTAGMFEDYQGEPGNKGEVLFTQTQMNTMVSQAAGQDIDVHIHALGERAITESLNAVEVARVDHPNSTTRYAICHVQVITDTDLPRFAALDVVAQSTPLWAAYDDFGKQFVSEDQFNRFFRFGGLKETGATMSFGSDFPASGAGSLGMSPLFNIEIGHTRQEPGKPDSNVQPRESERLDIASLIEGYTIGGAYQLNMEDQIGSITVGKKADLVVLSENVFEVDPYSVHKIAVEQTILGGKTVYTGD
ncbi:MAG: amidohydrolase [Pseudomonadales bacterium]